MAERKQGRRSAQTAEETKMHILCVAGSMFCKYGFEKVSLRNISESAGVSHSLIRHHFGSKEQIWYAISDALHDYMKEYIAQLISEFPQSKPANVLLYTFAVRLLAHALKVPYPIQFAADAVRQEGEFFDYFIDQQGKFEDIMFALTDRHNEEHPDNPISMYEVKWQLIMNAHGATSLKPLLGEIWKEQTNDPDQALYNHWNLFNKQMVRYLEVPQDEVLQPDSLDDLLLPLCCKFEEHVCQDV
ncbi:TetR/AcrR family transcriptional regulator [Vibrio sp. SCSIO 43137]|uniref:TetR/AcrR family transcriptional regulator n=1 Tax=Vibrio sp. SCSIO 43137 TaxID=3021011 RepID=UPI002307D186|nr:TetR/AcrR family transcriptional regulator [Vibrio sp. SCSIO 43137]WCE31620.1 TetR/AcrR family transcriptional regulator [Vibrio sp. SCSIO 43137]